MIEMPGSESAVFIRAHACLQPYKIIIDTNHYKGNYPESCLIEYAAVASDTTATTTAATNANGGGVVWKKLVGRLGLCAHKEHVVEGNGIERVGGDHIGMVRVTMYPDGGISRVRMFATKA